jgi:hypothetical protein
MHFMGHGIEKAYGADTSAKASGVHSEMATAQQHLLATNRNQNQESQKYSVSVIKCMSLSFQYSLPNFPL